MPPTPSLLARFQGSLLGLAVGDAACAPFEGVPATAIYYDFGGARSILANHPVSELTYTDDTQMTLSVAQTLLDHHRVDVDALAARFADNYDPTRGYGPAARDLLEAVRAGGDYRTLAPALFNGAGSLGNGAAMRVAPVGLFFHHDLDHLATEAAASALPTHTHPVGIDGARILAVAVALALRSDPATPFDKAAFYTELITRAQTDEFRHQLARAASLTPSDSVGVFGNRLEADRSVTTAIACFTMTPDSYPATLATALCLGGDVDTLAAMAGAISGAGLGIAAIPKPLLARLENGPQGRDHLLSLATRLHALHESVR